MSDIGETACLATRCVVITATVAVLALAVIATGAWWATAA